MCVYIACTETIRVMQNNTNIGSESRFTVFSSKVVSKFRIKNKNQKYRIRYKKQLDRSNQILNACHAHHYLIINKMNNIAQLCIQVQLHTMNILNVTCLCKLSKIYQIRAWRQLLNNCKCSRREEGRRRACIQWSVCMLQCK